MPFPLQAEFTVISSKKVFPNIFNAVEFRIDFGMDWGTMPQNLDEGKLLEILGRLLQSRDWV